MRRIHLANIILICILGTLTFWPNIKPSNIYGSLTDSYNSVCMVSDKNGAGSGVLLESGFILTAAHVIDKNMNGVLEASEERVEIFFPNINFKTQATAILISTPEEEVDIAVLDPDMTIPLRGSRLMSIENYRKLTIGTPIVTIGMQLGTAPANITDGRLIETDPSYRIHRNSANSYMGNSGGGLFVNNQLAGIVTSIAYDRLNVIGPIYENKRQVGEVPVPYIIPMANYSLHSTAPAIADYLNNADLLDILRPNLNSYPYQEYTAVAVFNLILVLWLVLVFRLMAQWIE